MSPKIMGIFVGFLDVFEKEQSTPRRVAPRPSQKTTTRNEKPKDANGTQAKSIT